MVDCYQPPPMKKSWTPPPLKIDWCTSQKQKKTWKRLRIVCHFCKDGFPRNKDSVEQVNRLFFLSLCAYWISNNFATFCFTILCLLTASSNVSPSNNIALATVVRFRACSHEGGVTRLSINLITFT